MMHVIYTVCTLSMPEHCETRQLIFTPRQPIACIFAAGPELAPLLSEDERIVTWSCADTKTSPPSSDETVADQHAHELPGR